MDTFNYLSFLNPPTKKKSFVNPNLGVKDIKNYWHVYL